MIYWVTRMEQVHESGIGNAMITNTFFWGLFPKFEDERLYNISGNFLLIHEYCVSLQQK